MSQKVEPKVKIIIADDHPAIIDGLKLMLEMERGFIVTGEATNGAELITMVEQNIPDIIITDIKMPGVDGVQAIKQIKSIHDSIGVIAFSMFDDKKLVIDMLEAGAYGYLLKNSSQKQLVEAVYSVLQKKPYYCESINRRMLKMIADSAFDPFNEQEHTSLTETEKEIIIFICEGYSNKQIAGKLKHTKRTIDTYRQHIMAKLELTSTAALVIYAVKKGIYTDIE